MNRKITAIALILCSLIFSCQKEKKASLTLSTDLTACPATEACNTYYINNSDLSSTGVLQAGSERVFVYETVSTALCSMTTRLYFKTQLGASQFDIGTSQIATDQVAYSQSCVCCDFISVKPVGGEIKGEQTDASHWLINARVVLSSADKRFTDTLIVNQYFSANSLVTVNP